MTTPYGTTAFARSQSSAVDRWIEVTDPLGGKERVQSKEAAPGINNEPEALVRPFAVTLLAPNKSCSGPSTGF